VSADRSETLKKWAGQKALPFILLSDPNGEVCRQYGAWSGVDLLVTKVGFPARSTIIIGEDGRTLRTFYGVKAAGHAADMLKEVCEIG
jgi:peroxiredoxin Q/BCP